MSFVSRFVLEVHSRRGIGFPRLTQALRESIEMPFGEDLPKDMRSRRRRRGPRMNSRIPVTIEWNRPAAAASQESGFTRVVNGHGCLLVSQTEPQLKQPLRVTNLSTRKSAEGLVVWKGTQRTDGWDVGVELEATDYDFWGVEL
jgi:hypothetical protein